MVLVEDDEPTLKLHKDIFTSTGVEIEILSFVDPEVALNEIIGLYRKEILESASISGRVKRKPIDLIVSDF
jgi:hypothetical protein